MDIEFLTGKYIERAFLVLFRYEMLKSYPNNNSSQLWFLTKGQCFYNEEGDEIGMIIFDNNWEISSL